MRPLSVALSSLSPLMTIDLCMLPSAMTSISFQRTSMNSYSLTRKARSWKQFPDTPLSPMTLRFTRRRVRSDFPKRATSWNRTITRSEVPHSGSTSTHLLPGPSSRKSVFRPWTTYHCPSAGLQPDTPPRLSGTPELRHSASSGDFTLETNSAPLSGWSFHSTRTGKRL